MKQQQRSRAQRALISTGTTSIVLIFVMLCLLTFAVLSLVSAQANLRLSRRSAERTTAYYAAENAANDVLLGLLPPMRDAAAAVAGRPAALPPESSEDIRDAEDPEAAGSPAERYFALVRASTEDVDGVQYRDDQHLAYSVPLGEDQVLAVELTLLYPPQNEGRYYKITAWRAVSEYDWNSDAPVELFDPGSMFG